MMKGGETMPKGRITDKSADVYGDFAVRVMNSIRHAKKRQGLMSAEELVIVEAVEATLIANDPQAVAIREARVRTY